MIYFVIFIMGLFVTLLTVPFAKRAALLLNALDKPSARKVHKQPMPRLGGIAIFAGYFCAVLTGIAVALFKGMDINYSALFGLILGSVIILCLGILDDIKNLSPVKKLFWQAAAALVPIMFGVQITFISNPFSGMLLLGAFTIPVTLFWIMAITNALNFIDGLDGLASGISAIAAVTLFIVAIRIHQPGAAIIMAALAGAAIGFLRYNFNPASIFLGDSGSLFLGFMLAAASVEGVLKSTMFLSLLIPIFILAVPIFDAASVIFRRMQEGSHIFYADRRHIHHRLLDIGLNQRQIVLSIYSACILLSAGTLAFAFMKLWQALVVLFFIFIFSFLMFNRIKNQIRKIVAGAKN